MGSQDFIRQLPGMVGHFKRPGSLSQRLHLDLPLLACLVLLTGYGLFVLYSASDQNWREFSRQLSYFGIAYVGMFVLAQFEPRFYQRWAPLVFIFGIGFLIAVLVLGIGAKGAQRWLQIPGLPRFQPSEIMKLAVPLTVSWYLADRALPPRLKEIGVVLVIIAIPTVLIAKQPDLGTSLLIASSGIFVLLLSGVRWRLVGGFALLAAAAAPVMWFFILHDYQKSRVLTFLNPERDPLGSGWNIIQSKTAIGSGGIEGKGWMSGTQSHLDFLPESHTDFIIAVLAEELGLVGVVLLLSLYVLIISRGLYISVRAKDTFSRLLAGSITLTFFVYIVVNIGMVSGLLPVVGVPLPLVSYGGTSIVTLMAGFGLLMSIHTHQKFIAH